MSGRRLTKEEIEILKDVFGNEVDYRKVRIHDRHWTAETANIGAFVFGNNIQISSKYMGDKTILIHETAHVWQFQNKWGWGYFFNALFDHLRSYVDRHDPYDYSAVEEKLPWNKWSAEQQAQWIGLNERLPGRR